MICSSSSLELELSSVGPRQSKDPTEQTLAKGFQGSPLQTFLAPRQAPFPERLSNNGKASCSTGSGDETSPQSEYPTIPWLTQSWLAKANRYERIATACPRPGIGLIGQGLLEHHISLLPGRRSPADFISVRNEDGGHVRYRAKVRTWPLLKRETIEVREFAA